MKITKYGHSCIFIEEGEARILIDPGCFCFDQTGLSPENLPECNILILTHNHKDHVYPEAIDKIVIKSKPIILTNQEVKDSIRHEARIFNETNEFGVNIKSIKGEHEFITEKTPRVENTGVLINNRLFHPGDCFSQTEKVSCEILAVPVAAPWLRIQDSVDFIKRVNPKIVFPIHDAIVKYPEQLCYSKLELELEGTGIKFVRLGQEAKEF